MAKFDFEKAIARLEEISQALEKGELTLDETIKLYTEGTKLASQCAKSLEDAQLKITKINLEKDENDG